jgi:hypothetical protein
MIFCEIVVPMEVSIPAKFYCFMATRFCQKEFWGTIFLRRNGIPSHFMFISKPLNALSNDLLCQYIQHGYVFKVFKFDI